jgi:ubiquinone/menaquinone biosynthesis C-methylase UbiE
MKTTTDKFVPAAGHDLFLPLYDPLTVLFGFARARRQMLARAELRAGERVLDVGCGTGTLLVALGLAHPEVVAVGLDPDPKALARAERKLRRAGLAVRLERGSAAALGFESESFDCVLSSFMFHHLDAPSQRAMLGEVFRVLKPGGRLELMDFEGRPKHRARWRLGEAGEATGVLASMQEAGFSQARVIARSSSWFGAVLHYRALRAAVA